MTIVRLLSLSLAAIAVPIFGFGMDIEEPNHGAALRRAPLCEGQRSQRRVALCRTHRRRGDRPILAGLWRNAKFFIGGVVFGPGRIDENGGDLASRHRKSRFSPRPLLPPASAGKRTTRGHRRRPPVPVYRPIDGQHRVPERRDLSTRGAHRAWLDPCRPNRLFLFRSFQGSAPGSPMFRSSFCAWETFASGRKSTPATRISSIPARSTSTRLCSTVWSEAASSSIASTTSTSGHATGASTGLSTGSRTAR